MPAARCMPADIRFDIRRNAAPRSRPGRAAPIQRARRPAAAPPWRHRKDLQIFDMDDPWVALAWKSKIVMARPVRATQRALADDSFAEPNWVARIRGL